MPPPPPRCSGLHNLGGGGGGGGARRSLQVGRPTGLGELGGVIKKMNIQESTKV